MNDNLYKNDAKNVWDGVWRETSDAFVDYLNKIGEQVFHCIRFENIQILYIDCSDKRHEMDDYIQSFIGLFKTMANLEEKQYCLVFLPDTNNNYFQRDLIIEVMAKLKTRDVLILYKEGDRNDFIKREFPSYAHVKVTYNSTLNLLGYCDLDDYMNCLSRNQRHYLKKSIKKFSTYETLDIRKFNVADYKAQVIDLYRSCCLKHEDFVEGRGFLNNLEVAENVEWYGVFEENSLIMFSGYWKNKDSVVLGMFGKEYKKEKLLRDSRAYFVLKLKMIENSIHEKKTRVYDGYGVRDIKQSLGFRIDDYAIMVKPSL